MLRSVSKKRAVLRVRFSSSHAEILVATIAGAGYSLDRDSRNTLNCRGFGGNCAVTAGSLRADSRLRRAEHPLFSS
jgi:hypothetical protein